MNNDSLSKIKKPDAGSTTGSYSVAINYGIYAAFVVFLWLNYGAAGPLPQIGFAQDLGVMCDAGWRFLQGQMPHRDYISALGPAYALMVGLPLKIGGPSYESYATLPLIVAAVFGFVCLLATTYRVPPWASILYSVIVAAVAGGTYHIGWSPDVLTFATFFNRQGWAALMIIAAISFLPYHHQNSPERADYLGGIVTGLLLGCLLFYKTNFFVAGCLLVTAGTALRVIKVKTAFTLSAVAAFALCVAVFASMIDWDLKGMIRDLTFAAESRRLGFVGSKHWNPIGRILINDLEFMICFTVAIYAVTHGWKIAASILGILVLGGYLLTNTNSSATGAGIPLVFSGLLIAALLMTYGDRMQEGITRSRSAVLLFGVAVSVGAANLLIPQLLSWSAWPRTIAIGKIGQLRGFDASIPPLQQLYVGDFNSWGGEYVPLVKEGVKLITENVPKEKTLYYIDFTNIFNFAAQAKSPKHTFLWHDEYGSLARSSRGHPRAEDLFKDVDFVMLPKRPFGPDGISIWLELYAGYLQERYARVTETENFLLLSRR